MLTQSWHKAVVQAESSSLIMSILCLNRRGLHCVGLLVPAPLIVQELALLQHRLSPLPVSNEVRDHLSVLPRKLVHDVVGLVLNELGRLFEDDRFQISQLHLEALLQLAKMLVHDSLELLVANIRVTHHVGQIAGTFVVKRARP